MKRKSTLILLVILIVAVLLFSAACTTKTGTGTTPTKSSLSGIFGKKDTAAPTTAGKDYATGKSGLEFGFIKDNPPSVLYDLEGRAEEFAPLIQIWNKGTAEVAGLKLYLSGFDTNIINFGSGLGTKKIIMRDIPTIPPKSTLNPEGGFIVYAWDPAAQIVLPTEIDRYPAKILLTACYEYKTAANPILCVDPDPFSPIKSKVCEAKADESHSYSGGQGAPVVVSSIRQINTPGKISLIIEIANQGGFTNKGLVLNKAILAGGKYGYGCMDQLQYQDVNVVNYVPPLLGNIQLTCQPIDHVILQDGKAIITCTGNLDKGQSAFLSPLKLTLSYGYMESIMLDVDIRSTS